MSRVGQVWELSVGEEDRLIGLIVSEDEDALTTDRRRLPWVTMLVLGSEGVFDHLKPGDLSSDRMDTEEIEDRATAWKLKRVS